jgi:hypothetical protein
MNAIRNNECLILRCIIGDIIIIPVNNCFSDESHCVGYVCWRTRCIDRSNIISVVRRSDSYRIRPPDSLCSQRLLAKTRLLRNKKKATLWPFTFKIENRLLKAWLCAQAQRNLRFGCVTISPLAIQ